MTEVSRGEFDLLRQVVSDQGARLTSIDDHGTRGVGVVQQQLTDLLKDVTSLQGDMNARFAAHELVHEKEEQQRRQDRRWRIGLAVAGIGSIGGMYGWIAYLVPHH